MAALFIACTLSLPAWGLTDPTAEGQDTVAPAEKPPVTIKPDDFTDTEVEAVSTAISAAIQTVMQARRAGPPSEIRGRCTYENGFCPGALVELKDSSGKVLGQQTLSSADGFVFSGLKSGRYRLAVSYSRYKLKPYEQTVETGSDVLVKLTEPGVHLR